jgi:hypothetical protein
VWIAINELKKTSFDGSRDKKGKHFRITTVLSCYSTVTDFARFLGWSTSHPRRTAM